MRLRLLHCQQISQGGHIDVSFEEYDGEHIPPYAILSHRWGPTKDEVSFNDINSGSAKSKRGYAKVQGCCTQALEDGFRYVWIDSCCIDKSSSAELSEAINSMYCYYVHAAVCYAYLEDVRDKEDPHSIISAFRSSKWFRRGWTLQELIAPKAVIFLSHSWIELGTRATLVDIVEEITGVEKKYLTGHPVSDANIAKRMSWAARRTTTRIEDRAYSLMGLFGVNMPAIYGEGHKAFTRLQVEILKTSTDQTIFAWDDSDVQRSCGMPADDVYRFRNGSAIEQLGPHELISHGNLSNYRPPSLRFHYELTNFGLHIWLPVQHVFRHSMSPLLQAALDCTDTRSGPRRHPILVALIPTDGSSTFIRCIRTGELPDFSGEDGSLGPLKFQELFIMEPSDWSAVHAQSSEPYLPYGTLEIHFHALQGFVLLSHYPQKAAKMQSPFVLPASDKQQFTFQFWNEKTTEIVLIYGKLSMNGAWLHLTTAPAHCYPGRVEDYHQRCQEHAEDTYRGPEELWFQVDLPLSKTVAIMSARDLKHPHKPGLVVFKTLRVNLRTVPPARALL